MQDKQEINEAELKYNKKYLVNWEIITAITTMLALVFAAIGLFVTASQINLSRQIAKSEFLRGYYDMIQQYNDIQIKLAENGEWRKMASLGPETEEEWFRLQRYIGLLEQINYLHHDGIMELNRIDSAYSHRIKSIATHPAIQERLFERETYRWTAFNDLVSKLEHMPVYKRLSFPTPNPN